MVKVFKRKAGKDYPKDGIKKGEEYWTWSFFRSPPVRSKTAPTRSQLTQDSAKSSVYEAYDNYTASAEPDGIEAIISALDDAASEFRDRFENMPEGFQQGDTGQKLEENADACESASSELQDIMSALDDKEGDYWDGDELQEDALAEAVSGTEPDL